MTAVYKMMIAGAHPTTWDDFKGQDAAKNMLRRAARAARLRDKPLEHTLIESPMPGIGKTSLALLAGAEMGPETYVHVVSGDLTHADFLHCILSLRDNDILVIDEFHRVFQGGRGKGEYLLHYLQQGTLLSAGGGVEEDLPQVTIMATTTELDRLPAPVVDRFTYKPRLQPYTVEQGAEIAVGMSTSIFGEVGLPTIDHDTAVAVATATAARPRQMQRLLRSVRDLALDSEIDPTPSGAYDLRPALEDVNLTADGLTEDALAYLSALATHGQARPLGKQQVADLASLGSTQLAEAEALLLGRGYLELARAGRSLTVAGTRRAMNAGLLPNLRIA